MKKPNNYELKKWIHENIISGLRLYYYQFGVDTSDTDWELTPDQGKPKRVKAHTVESLVDLKPDWIRVLRLKPQYEKEIKDWDAFAKKEKRDLAEYKRLQRKFS